MISDKPDHFILRRAFRLGRVTRGDVQAAYPEFSYSKAGLVLGAAVEDWPEHLERDGRSVVPRARAGPPAVADEGELMAALDQGLFGMRYTGFAQEELPAHQVRWVCSGPRKSGVLLTLGRIMAEKGGAEVCYVGLRAGEAARWRRVFPLALEQMGLQWRLLAQCLESEGYPLKVFVLTRILDAAPMSSRLPRGFAPRADTDRTARYRVRLNPQLTADQQAAVAAELCLEHGRVVISQRSRWEFERQFGHARVHEDAVWPPVDGLEEE